MSRTASSVQRIGAWLGVWLAALGAGSLAMAQQPPHNITVLTHDSFALPLELIESFTQATGIRVVILPAGDAGEVVNRAILTKARPIADLLYGIDDSLLERARSEAIFEPYLSPELARVALELRFDSGHLVTPVNVGYVIPNVDLAWFAQRSLGLPESLEQLTDATYRGLTAVQNPASSSPGLAFMLATIARFGDPAAGIAPLAAEAAEQPAAGGQPGDGAGSQAQAGASPVFADWLDFWAALRDNDLAVADGWTETYYTLFSRYGGDRPIVVSYLTSPAAELIFAEQPLEAPPTANLSCTACAYRQIEAIGILRGTQNTAAAAAFVDFMLGREVQEAISLQMFVHPATADAALPPEFVRFAVLGAGVAAPSIDSAVIQANQQRWLEQWTAVVLQRRAPVQVR